VTIEGTVTSIAELNTKPQIPGQGWILSPPGDLYVWDSTTSTWDNVGQIVGPQGPTGATGATGPTGPQGIQGTPAIVGVADGPYGSATSVPVLTVASNQITNIVDTPIQTPYDLAGEVVGTLVNGSELFHFIAARAFTLNSTASTHKFECVTASTGPVTLTLAKFSGMTAVNLLVATYSAGNPTAVVTQAPGVGVGDFAISAGDKLVLTIAIGGGETFSTPYFTLFGVA
jgi:hypothetical protein